jgi:lysophospholipase L1-like esterase
MFEDKIMRKHLTKYTTNLLLLFLSVSFSLIIGEVLLRRIFKPVNYLKPYLVRDDILGHKIKPNSAGHDSWGYRNTTVPNRADIVAIGDSMTYGVSATADNSWPALLQKYTGKVVYNLSLGGYSPVQYYYLLSNNALKLNPSIIITGFYYGNDLLEAKNMVDKSSYWKSLVYNNTYEKSISIENMSEVTIENVKIEEDESRKFMGNMRNLLSHYSVLYRIITFNLADFARFLEVKFYYGDRYNLSILDINKPKIHTAFSPIYIFKNENLEDVNVQEGINISLKLFIDMNSICKSNGIHFVVLLIPTKENVYSKYIKENKSLKNSDIIDNILNYESIINSFFKEEFKNHNILFVDVLEDLRNAVDKKRIYNSNEDGHPNEYGYEIIARALYQFFQQSHFSDY